MRTFVPRFDVEVARFDVLFASMQAEPLEALDPPAREARIAELRDQGNHEIDSRIEADLAAQRAAHAHDQTLATQALADALTRAESAATQARAAAHEAHQIIDTIDEPDADLALRLGNLTDALPQRRKA